MEKALVLLQNTVFSFSMKMCGQRQDAEDAMQEVLLNSVPHLPKFNNPKALLVWLYKVAKTRCLMSRRRSKFAPKEALSLEELMPDRQELRRLPGKSEATPETLLMSSENAKRLRGAIQQLPPGYRLILVLHDMEELSDDDIAKITGLRPGTIRVRLHRARLFVRREVAKQDRQGARGEAKKQAAVAQTHSRERSCKQMFKELSNYLDQELDDSLCAELEKHMEGCDPCKAFLASLEETIQTCKTAPNEVPDARMAANLRREVLSEYQGLMAQLNRISTKRPTADRVQAH
ncbi:MAG TPA: sigma-70 family RNA polymerase sigma factor [Candidatus Acidoferrum sp.]|nr:sigma-70 family RNA polymerase sigma factor [Candidatus Acidoferrum sp.]